MKKNKSKTDDLLKRLGASLKESPLNAHARGVSETPTRSAVIEKPVAVLEQAPARTAANDKVAARVHEVMRAEKETAEMKRAGEPPREIQQRSVREMGVAAGSEQIFGKAARRTAVMANEQAPEVSSDGAKKFSAVEFMQGANEMMMKTAAPLTNEQVSALQGAPVDVKNAVRMQDGLPAAESLKTALDKLGVPMNDRQMVEMKELQTMREAIAELKKLQAQAQNMVQKPAPAESMAPQTGWTNYAGGSQRATASGWKTSTVGLYPEDYDKAYELMNYLRAQTGQAVNLSRVIKIALRAMEVGPEVLKINEQIRAKDGRLLSRRG